MISVVIPMYNVRAYLSPCLNAVLSQTIRDIEVICVDDGSTDDTLTLAKEYAQRDSRVRVIACEHSNAGHCRNVGMAEAKGEWLSFLDADDVFAPKMLEEMVSVGEAKNTDIVTCGFKRFDDGTDFGDLLKGRDAGFVVVENPANQVDVFDHWVGWAWDKLFRREFVERNNLKFQEVAFSNDLRFVYSALALARGVAETQTSFIAHRMHPKSLQATRKKDPTTFLRVLRSLESELKKHGAFAGSSALRDAFLRHVVRFSIFQLDYIGSVSAHGEVRNGVVAYWRELDVEGQLSRLCNRTTYCRCKIVIHWPWLEWLYYCCVKAVTCNPNVRRTVKRILKCKI